jgi:hypothetical protein
MEMKKMLEKKIFDIYMKKQKSILNDLTLEIKQENQVLDNILIDKQIQYLGTDPVKDLMKINK